MMNDTNHLEPSMREVVVGLTQARDAQVSRVVAMVDGMPDRGDADALIAPLRARLAQIRPARPFGFTRLLFSPLDTIIVPSQRWRRGEIGVPRPALAPLGQALQAALPELSQSLEPSACRLTPDDRPAIAALGAPLWPAAATALRDIQPPANWTQASGLVMADFIELAGVIAAILRQAPQIETMAASRQPPTDTAIRDVLCRAAPAGGLALATIVAVLMARLSLPARVLIVASEINAGGQAGAADRAMEHTLAGLQASMADDSVDHGTAAEAAIEATRVASLLAGLEEASPERRKRLEPIRKEADALCRRRFDRVVATTLSQTSAAATVDYDDEALIGLENAARDIRRLENAGRRLGSGDHYDTLVQTVSTHVREQNGLGLSDRVRMVEILSGPDEALALLLSGQR